MSAPRQIHEPARQLDVIGEYEVVVVGGGPAGIAAAVSAARAGRKTALLERYGFLGGAGTAAGLSTFCGLHANVHGEHRHVVHGIADEILQRLAALNGLNDPHVSLGGRVLAQAYDISAYKIVGDELLTTAGVDILFHSVACAVSMKNAQTIDAVVLESKSGRQAVSGAMFIDCSGDGDIAAWAGAPYELGDGAGNMLYPSTMFRIGGVDPVKAGRAWETIPRLMQEAEQAGRRFPRKGVIVRPQKNPTEWRANVTQIANPDGSAVSGIDVRQLSYGEMVGRRQCQDVFDFIREATPGFENAYIVEIAPQIGIRESRRVAGRYMMTEQDIVGCVDFDDSIGVNGWPVEQHSKGQVELRWPAVGSRGYNHLPYRMLVPQRVTNLLVAGRCASMTHDGQSSARVSGPCFEMGQAAGMAVDLALRDGCEPAAIDVAQLQQRLRAIGTQID